MISINISSHRKVIHPVICIYFRFRNVLLHGDLWSNNLMFRREKDGNLDALIVDFQLARYGPPAHDMMTFLHLVQTREFAQNHEKDILDRYYKRLGQELSAEDLDIESLLPQKEWNESIKHYREFAILTSIFYFQLILTPSDISAEFLASPELFDECMYVDRSKMVIACFENDELCRFRMVEAMKEAAEMYNWI